MKHVARMMLFLMVGVVATGCDRPTYEDSPTNSDDPKTAAAKRDDPETAAAQREEAITATKEAAESIKNYSHAEKDKFIDEAKRELADIRSEVERLRAEVDRSSGEARADAEARLEVVRQKLDAAKAQIDRAETATEDSWDDVRSGYWTAREDLRTSFDQTRQWMSDRMEP